MVTSGCHKDKCRNGWKFFEMMYGATSLGQANSIINFRDYSHCAQASLNSDTGMTIDEVTLPLNMKHRSVYIIIHHKLCYHMFLLFWSLWTDINMNVRSFLMEQRLWIKPGCIIFCQRLDEAQWNGWFKFFETKKSTSTGISRVSHTSIILGQ